MTMLCRRAAPRQNAVPLGGSDDTLVRSVGAI